MNAIVESAAALEARGFLLDLAVKSSVVFAAAWLAALALRRSSAASRHLVWSLAIVASLAIPVLSLSVPQWPLLPAAEPALEQPLALEEEAPAMTIGPFAQLAPPALAGTERPDVPPRPAAEDSLPVEEMHAAAAQAAADFVNSQEPMRWLLPVWLLPMWLCGAVLAFLPFVGGWLRSGGWRRIVKRSLAVAFTRCSISSGIR